MGAIGRWMKSMWYYVTFRVDKAAEILNMNPGVIKAKYEALIRNQKDRLDQFINAVSMLINLQEQKKMRLEKLKADNERQANVKAGAIAMMKKKLAELQKQGLTEEQIKQNPDYMKCLSGFQDCSTTLKRNTDEIAELEKDIDRMQKDLEGRKIDMTNLKNEIMKTKEEAGNAVAEVISAQQMIQLNQVMAGISTDGTAEMREELRDTVGKIKAKARITSELAGTDANRQAAEFEKYATQAVASNEFDALIGLKSEESTEGLPGVSDAPVADSAAKLPE